MASKKLKDVSPIMMDAIGDTLERVIGENLKYAIVVFDPSTGAFKIRSNVDIEDLSKTFQYVGKVYSKSEKVCIACEHTLPIDYFDGGVNPDKCYLCDELPF